MDDAAAKKMRLHILVDAKYVAVASFPPLYFNEVCSAPSPRKLKG